jgi:hypothetical protein
MGTVTDNLEMEAAEPSSYFFEPPPNTDPFRMERRAALLVILAAAWYLRAMNASYCSAYMDESVYVLYGRMFLARHFEAPIDEPLRWSFGWYLWPMMAAIADKLGGIVAVRELAALLGTATVGAVYGFARRLFSPVVGLASAAAFAILAPAIYNSRIATRDSGSLFFFALGLWAYTCAFQENRKRDWLAACASFFAAFLCKYVVALFFPFLVLLAFRRKLRALLLFALPLTLSCAGYAAFYRHDLAALLSYGAGYNALRAQGAQVWDIYLWRRLDFWIIAALSLLAFLGKTPRRILVLLWLGAALFLVFQWKTRADYDYWKHAAYPLFFLVPLSMEGLLATAGKFYRRDLVRQVMVSAFSVVVLCGILGWLGRSWKMEEFVFWPNVEPALAYMEGRISSTDRVLVDDTVFRYYFHPQLRQRQLTDPFYFWYQGQMGGPAYAAALRDGVFQYVVLDGGIGDDAQQMQAAIRPVLSQHYSLRFAMPEPQLGHPIEIYARSDVRSALNSSAAVRVAINSPQTGSVVLASGIVTRVEGMTSGAPRNSRIRIEVFTNRWYSQPEIALRPDGSFSEPVYLGGEGNEQCHHMIRARLYDEFGYARAMDLVYNVARANPDGNALKCR